MDYWFNTLKSQHDQSVNIGQAQNSGSQYPSQQGADNKRKRKPASERRKAVIEQMLAANRAILSDTEMKVVGSMFSHSQGQSTTYVRDPFKNTNYSNSKKFPKKKPDDREFAEIFGKPKYPSGNKQPEKMVGSFLRQESDMHRGGSPLGYDRTSNSYGQIPSREMSTFGGERSQVHRETWGGSLPSTSEKSRFGNETRRRSPPNSERSRFGHGIRERSPFTTRERRPFSDERDQFRRETRELSPLNRDRSPLDRNRSSYNRRDARNMSRETRTGVDERIDFIPPGDNPYEPNRMERINPFMNNRNLDYTRDSAQSEYVITAKDQYSKAWLDDMVPKLKGHRGVDLRVADIKELPPIAVKAMMAPPAVKQQANTKHVSTTSVVAVLWLRRKTCDESPRDILSKLEAQNAGLSTSHWLFIRKQGNRKRGLTMNFKIDNEDVTRLQRINMRPGLDGQQLKITIKPFKGKN
ncbi:uncharacterized protein [Diabrotica undecimpunctata]|uniref:uncharacterized protein isoform X4 n=1 Tax=Diabrotica undecimpunctata TaxID=50387 RepID=UPI003B635E1A